LRVERKAVGAPDTAYVPVGETNQFDVTGKVFTNGGLANSPPTLVADTTDPAINKPLAVLAGGFKDIDVLANDTRVDVAMNPTTLAPVASANSTVATARELNKVKMRYTPNAGFAGPDTVTYNVRTFTGTAATAPATVNILVEDLQVPTAEFLPKLMKWRIEGTSNTGGAGVALNIMEIRLGTATDPATGLPNGPVLGTAQVDTGGRWVFEGKSTLSPGAIPRTATGDIPISVTSGNGVARTDKTCKVR
jgi:hypothetical protein